MNRWYRLGIAVVLLSVVFGLGVHAEATGEERWPYTSSDALAAEYDQHVGEQTLLFGTVEETTDGQARIRVDYTEGTFDMQVREFDATVQSGGSVQVYGTLGPDYTITAERTAVVNPAGGSTTFKYVISGVAVVLFLTVFFRYWRPDFETLTLEGREDG